LSSRFFVHVFDSHWSSLAYTSKHSGQELRFTEPIKELNLPPGLEWKGSKTLKTATAEATGVGFFEFLAVGVEPSEIPTFTGKRGQSVFGNQLLGGHVAMA
jgi:hypothetical protein